MNIPCHMQHRDSFNEMLADATAGKIDLIIVKNISRFARNVVDFLSVLRRLAEKNIGVWFESEALYSMNYDHLLTLSFQAQMAEQESRIRSRSMETSLRMRLDHGLPLTPELLGFVKNEDGKLIINPKTYKIPKLMFYMDVTLDLTSGAYARPFEVRAWLLEQGNLERFVILDDDIFWAWNWPGDSFVCTTHLNDKGKCVYGMTDEDAEKAIEILNRPLVKYSF